jgi:adenylosuccinate lyase
MTRFAFNRFVSAVAIAACLLAGLLFGQAALAQSQAGRPSVEAIFAQENTNAIVMRIEAAIASAQADYGVVPRAAADEITAKADIRYAPLADIEAENAIVRHRMVALLNVWRRSLSPEAGDALHRGVTTVDIYDTTLVLQLLETIDLLLADMGALEQDMVCLAERHKDTPMMGRTLGQQALPITFGKKVAVWAAQNRRNMDRLYEVRARLRTSGVLKGAVGTHLGLGEMGVEIETGVSERLGLDAPEPADWRPARDVFAEYAQVLALIAKSNAAIGGEVFRLQMTEFGELEESRPATAVGSSTMPHKRNPSLSEALIYYGRTIPAMAEIVLADVESVFERDNTSRSNQTLADISIEAADMMRDTRRLVGRLVIHADRMEANMDITDGMIMSQAVVLFLADTMSKEEAEERVRLAAEHSLDRGIAFRDSLLTDAVIGPKLVDVVDGLLDPRASLGLASRQVTRTTDWIADGRARRGEPPLIACRGG